jgi:hypothetical protein
MSFAASYLAKYRYRRRLPHLQKFDISSAKVLEIPEQRFGMPELRHEHLRVGKSDWPHEVATSPGIGSRIMQSGKGHAHF